MSLLEHCKEVFIFLWVVLCGILLVPVVALAWVWKNIVQIIVFIFYRNLKLTFLGIIESCFYVEEQKDFYLKPKRSLLLSFVLDGQLWLDEVRKRVQKQAIEVRGLDGELTFVRLQQRLFKKLGYVFLGLDQNFNIANHITETQVFLNQDSIYEFVRNQSLAPYRSNSPLWEMLLVPNYNGQNKTFVSMRFHHLVMDGFSLAHLINAICDEGNITFNLPAKNSSHSSSKYQSWTNLYKKTIALPRTYYLEKSTRPTIPNFQRSDNGFFKVINKIPLQKFKDFKKQTSVSLTEVILYATSYAITEGYTKTVHTIGCATTLPLPTTGKTIGNNFSFADIHLPVGSMTPEERVRKCQATLRKAKTSVSPMVDGMKLLIGTIFPTAIFAKCFSVPKFFIMISNTPGPSVRHSLFGCYALDVFTAGAVVDSPAITILPMSYNGDLTISLGGLSQLFDSEEKFVKFVNYFENGLNTLLSSTNFPTIQPISQKQIVDII